MIKRIFILFLSMLGTVLFFGLFMFIFANSVQMRCQDEPGKNFTCTIEKKLMNQLVTSRRVVTGVTSARTVQDCDSDGCSYRSELQTANGGSEPFDDVYTDHDPVAKITDQINAGIRRNDGGFSVNADLQWWLVIMLGVMALVGLAVETALVFQAAYKWAVNRQW
jgi:hypothetical protein